MGFEDYEDEFEDQPQGPSKTQRKREAEALQALGEALVDLPQDKLGEVPMSPELAEAVNLARRIKQRGGRRRQLQLIGKLMRREDAEPIREAVERIKGRNAEAAAQLHRAERWRERLLGEGDAGLAVFLDEHPGADAQRLRQLIRAAQREQATGKPPKSYRELFRVLRDTIADA